MINHSSPNCLESKCRKCSEEICIDFRENWKYFRGRTNHIFWIWLSQCPLCRNLHGQKSSTCLGLQWRGFGSCYKFGHGRETNSERIRTESVHHGGAMQNSCNQKGEARRSTRMDRHSQVGLKDFCVENSLRKTGSMNVCVHLFTSFLIRNFLRLRWWHNFPTFDFNSRFFSLHLRWAT